MSARRSDDRRALARPLSAWLVAAALGSLALGTTLAAAQSLRDPSVHDQIRTIPDNTKLGRLSVGVFPEATLDRRPVRFTAGARIYGRDNLIVPPSSLTEPVDVLYRVDQQGQIDAAWILTADELAAARRRR